MYLKKKQTNKVLNEALWPLQSSVDVDRKKLSAEEWRCLRSDRLLIHNHNYLLNCMQIWKEDKRTLI